MITGEITVSTCYGDALIPVEIVGKGPRPGTVWVRALNQLAPFTRMSHGGPYQDASALWPVPRVRNVRIVADEAPPPADYQPPVDEAEPAPSQPVPMDWFLETLYEDRTYIEE